MFPYKVFDFRSSCVQILSLEKKKKLDWLSLSFFVLTKLMNMESVPVL